MNDNRDAIKHKQGTKQEGGRLSHLSHVSAVGILGKIPQKAIGNWYPSRGSTIQLPTWLVAPWPRGRERAEIKVRGASECRSET